MMDVIAYLYCQEIAEEPLPHDPTQTLHRVSHGTLRRLVSWTTSIALCSGASVAVSDAALAQTGPMPAQPGERYGLRLDDSSEDVVNVQRQLADLGYYNGEITGYLGPATQEAIVRFQQDVGLTPDGIVGPATAQALFESGSQYGYDRIPPEQTDQPYAPNVSTSGSAVQLNDSGDQVAELQQRLADLGYYSGEITGVFDYPTEAAVMQFQRDNQLTPDGIVGPSTEATLRRPTEELVAASASSSSTETFASDTPSQPSSTDGLLHLGDTGQTVRDIQLRLKELGFYQGAITGTYGPETEAAVIAFQQSRDLNVDGVAGPQVRSALFDFNAANNVDASNSVPDASSAANSTSVPNQASTDTLPSVNDTTVNNTNTPSNPPAAESNPNRPTANQDPTAQNLQSLEQARQEAEQARLEAEQARLEAEQARVVLSQNMEEGRYSIVSLQRQLRDEGYYPGEINGILTSETQDAIAEAQRQYGLSQEDLVYGSADATSVDFPF